ncbi:protein transport protein SEC24 C-like isoform X2 [Rutidosis leptorrhynchoides]|uniref:protein transport protein SEC24 C-like isoform X2 n=1 Tax=Rutidosis leptorrhynchoides TaxID=125765 RepID=UPI003A998E0A
MATPGGPRPGSIPPNYNPNSVSDNMKNLQINRPNQPPNPANAPRGPPPSLGQQPQSQSQPFSSPFSVPNRPGPPPPGVVPRGVVPPSSGPTPHGTLPPFMVANRPVGAGGPPGGNASLASRPMPPVPVPSTSGPGPFASTPSPTPPPVMPVGSGAMNNGPPMFGPPHGTPGGPQYPSSGVRPSAPTRPPPPPPQTMSSFLGGSFDNQPRGPPQVAPPTFSAPLRAGMQPSSGPPTFSSQAQPQGPPFGAQPWQMQSQQNVPPPSIPCSGQPPRMYGMSPPLANQQSMATISPATGPSGNAVSGPSKIDPNQIPRPVPSSSVLLHETRQGNQANPPPPATSEFIVRDTGNCSPRYMRSTINQIPCTAYLLNTSGMQLALLVQPLALPHPSEEPIQIVDFGEGGPVRCSRCKGYINPFMKFVDQGKRFICNFCGFTDETPREYQCNLGPDGRRRDADERPELCRGTVEFVATKEFLVREPMPAVFFFLIDVSMNALQTGAVAGACSAISRVVADLPEGPRTMVGIATFDSTIQFYNLKRAFQQPLMLIVPDIEDVYTPLQTDVIVQLSECRQHLDLLLESIPTMFQNNKTADSAFGAGVKAAFLAMKSTGGKLLVFQSVLPSVGIAALSGREAEGRTNIYVGDKTMAIEFAEYQVSVDVFITTQSYVDIASISVIPKMTGGQIYYYHPFSARSDPAKLYNDLRWNVTRPQGFEAVMRVRCSQGLQVQEYSGNFCKRIPTDVDLPAVDCDKSIMVSLKHDDKLQDGTECSFQCALLYTSVYGQRRIRVSTLSLPCTPTLSNLFRSADLDTQFSCFLKQAANEIPFTPLLAVRDRVTELCISILHSYRKYCATVSSSGQLILPEALKLLPLYTLALTKSIGLRSDGHVDDRSFWINYVTPLSVQLAIPLVYPRMISLHDLHTRETEGSVIPPPIPLSIEHVSDDGIYLLENGEDCLIYVGDSVDPDITQKLFGISSVGEIHSQFVLEQYDNPLSKKLNEVLNEIRSQRCNYLGLKLCKKGDPSGMSFFSYMVEDKSQNGLSYVEFLVHVHRQIQSKMT